MRQIQLFIQCKIKSSKFKVNTFCTLHFALCTLLILSVIPAAFSQEPVMTLNSPELGVHTRPLVSFPHENHASGIDCSRCHHDYDIFKANKNAEGRKCSECHTQKASSNNPVPLMKAFHLQCKGCHETMQKKGKTGQPLMCGQCHKK